MRAGQRRHAPALALAVAAITAAGCHSGTHAALPPESCRGPWHAISEQAPTGRAAAAAASTYLRALARRRPAPTAPQRTRDCRSLQTLRAWLLRVPVERLHVVAVPIGSAGPHAIAVLTTLTARLGHAPGTIPISLGQRVLAVGGGERPSVEADISLQHGAARDGLAAVQDAAYLVGRAGVVVSEGPAADARMARNVLDQVYPRLRRRYGAGQLPDPIVVIVPNLRIAEAVIGTVVTRYDAGIELGGLVVLIEPTWCCGAVQREGIVAHELTHAAARGLVSGPISLIEGVARYEEENWDAAHGAALSTADLAAAYRRGWSSLARWQSGLNLWYQVPGAELDLRYFDGAAIVREVVRDSGLRGLRRLAIAFDRNPEGYYPRAALDRAFRHATGRSFATVVAGAHARTLAGSE